jgi:hypothetical protein
VKLLACTFILLAASVAHGQEQQCPPNDTLCVAEVAAARLSAANARIASLTQINTDQKAIIDAKDQLIAVKDQIISNLQKIDTNSQKIDVLGQETSAIWREQHNEDKLMIVDLQKDLASCRGNQKWIFGGGAIIGGFVGYKIRGAGQIQNPFQSNLNFQSAEDRAKQATRLFTK